MISLKELKASEVVHVTQDNMAELIRFWSETTNSFHFIEDETCFRMKSSLPHPLFNNILKTNLRSEVQNHIRTIIHDYNENQVPFIWRVWDHDNPKNLDSLLRENGAYQIPGTALMAIDLESYHPMSEPLPELKIRTVRNQKHSIDFSECSSAVFDIPKLVSTTISEIIGKQDQNIDSYIGYIEDTPVSTGTIFYSNGVAGIYNVATLPDFQGKGIGVEMMTTMLLKAKLDDIKTTLLHATPAGIRLYEKLGFQTFGEMRQYLFTCQKASD